MIKVSLAHHSFVVLLSKLFVQPGIIIWCIISHNLSSCTMTLDWCGRARTRVADVAGNNNLTRTKSQYHRTHPGRLVNFSSFRVSNRHQQHPQQHQQQQQNAAHDGAGGGASAAVARAVAAGGSRLLSASSFGNTLQQHRQLQQQKRDAAQQLQFCDSGTSAVARTDSRKNHRKSAAAAGTSTTAAGTSLRYCKSVSPIAEKPPARQSPPRSASMNLQPRNFAAADSCLRWWWPPHRCR